MSFRQSSYITIRMTGNILIIEDTEHSIVGTCMKILYTIKTIIN
ncbi:hypothetical protein [Flavobacterium soli]|nr:hypothetical protein [Flavobacterium soli]